MTLAVQVQSEIAPLQLILTSSPGREFDQMLPENLERYRPGPDGRPVENPDYLLFDDLVVTSTLQAEHAGLVRVLRAVTGDAGHLDFRHILAGALAEPAARTEAIAAVLRLEAELYGQDAAAARHSQARFDTFDAPTLADAFVTGRDPETGSALLRWPAPNALFARDLAAAAGDALVLTYGAEPGRRRDMLLMRAAVRHHPLLRDLPRIDIADDGPVRAAGQPPATLEGGDIQVLAPDVVLIGVGLRTTLAAVERLAPRLHARGIPHVLACEMPRRRAAMHIDTLFTRIDTEQCLIYPPLVQRPQALGARVHAFYPDGHRVLGDHLLDALATVGVSLSPIFCGGHDPTDQAREQWSDGANAFALAPGVIISYGRNERTLRELNAHGYEIVDVDRFVANAMLYTRTPGRRVVVALPGHELVRGRGGPRCLTLPLRRGPTSS
jgi:arginine deiminase